MSQKHESFDLPLPFYNLCEQGPDFKRQKSRERISYLADKQTRAVNAALRLFEKTEHILWCDSYYLHQERPMIRLIKDYNGSEILGGSIWAKIRVRFPGWTSYYDQWSVPGSSEWIYGFLHRLPKGKIDVQGVGGVYIFPREVFDRVGKFDVPEPFPDAGCHHNYLCMKAGIPVRLSFDARFWRNWKDSDVPYYPLVKRLRCTLGPRTLARRARHLA